MGAAVVLAAVLRVGVEVPLVLRITGGGVLWGGLHDAVRSVCIPDVVTILVLRVPYQGCWTVFQMQAEVVA